MKYVLLYESADNVMEKAPVHYAAHSERLDRFHSRGDLLEVGTFADPQKEGSMAIFRTREAAEEFVRDDPFVNNGVVKSWRILDWDEIYG
ncbi:MAG TPA: YciI family protein [Actinomycetota bacterium]|nr:YciI family protein [Actinomycetota bacterium]